MNAYIDKLREAHEELGKAYAELSVTAVQWSDKLDNPLLGKHVTLARNLVGRSWRLLNEIIDDFDPTPYCHQCGAMQKKGCDCLPIAENN